MPVQRTYVAAQVKDTRQIEPVEGLSSQSPGQLMQWQAGKLAEKAAQNAAAMAVVAEDKAVALAKAAIIPVDVLGMPKAPDNVTEEMGSIARRTWDANIYDRTAQLLNTAVTNQINIAENDNQNDLMAFIDDVNNRETQLRKDLPTEMEGAFSSVWSSSIVGASAKIGHRKAVQERADSADQFGAMVSSWKTTIQEAVLIGNPKAPDLVQLAIDRIRSQKTTVVSIEKQQEYINDLTYQYGLSRIFEDNQGFDNYSSSQLEKMIVEIGMMDTAPSPELRPLLEEYFYKTAPSGRPQTDLNGNRRIDWEKAQKFASKLWNKKTLLGQKENKAEDNLKLQSKSQDVLMGRVSGSPERRVILNHIVSTQTERDYAPNDWLGLGLDITEEDLNSVMAQSKKSGFLPSSLQKAFKQLSNTKTPEMYEALYPVFKYLESGPSGESGNFVDMNNVLSTEAIMTFQMASDMADSGMQFQDSLREATKRIELLNERTPDWERNNKAQLSSLINAMSKNENSLLSTFLDPIGLFPTNNSSADLQDADWVRANPDQAMKHIVKAGLFMGEDVYYSSKELDTATRIFELHLRDQIMVGKTSAWEDPIKNALELSKSSMQNRFVYSEYMNVRSASAPEKHFRAPPALDYVETMQKWGKMALGLGLKGAEIANPAGVLRFLNAFDTGPNPSSNWATMELGADQYWAETQDPFALIASDQINALLNRGAYPAGMPTKRGDLRLFDDDAGGAAIPNNGPFVLRNRGENNDLNRFNREFLRGGEDYILVPNVDSGSNDSSVKPTFRVMMNSGSSGWQIVNDPNTDAPFILDVREEFAQMNKTYEAAKLAMAAADVEAAQQTYGDVANGAEALSTSKKVFQYFLEVGAAAGQASGGLKTGMPQ